MDYLQRIGVSRSEWQLDPEYTFLNHGSYGATPRTVIAEQDRWRERMELHPTGFMTYELPTALREAAARLAAFVGCDTMDLVFVENATDGCNAVLNSIPLSEGDEILVTDHGYAAVRNAAEYVAKKTGARVVEAKVSFPIANSGQNSRRCSVQTRSTHADCYSRPRYFAHRRCFPDPGISVVVPSRRGICSY